MDAALRPPVELKMALGRGQTGKVIVTAPGLPTHRISREVGPLGVFRAIGLGLWVGRGVVWRMRMWRVARADETCTKVSM